MKLTRDTIGTDIDEAVLVCAVDSNDGASTEYIWLVGDGTIENAQVYVTETNVAPDTTAASTTTTENASAAAVAIANNAVAQIDTDPVTGDEVIIYTPQEAGTSATDAEVASALKGNGTETDPFLVYDYETMQKISLFCDSKPYSYYKVDISKTDNGNIDCKNWIPVNIRGSFDGSNVNFINLDNVLFWNVKTDDDKTVTFSNLTIRNCNIVQTGSTEALARNVDDYGVKNLIVDNVKASGYIEGQGQTASFIGYPGSGVLTFKNCVSTAKVVAIGDCAAGFVVNPYMMLPNFGGTSESKIVLDNSYFEGSLATTKSAKYKNSGDTSYNPANACGAYVYAHNITINVEFVNELSEKSSLHVEQIREGYNNRIWNINSKNSLIVANKPQLDLSNVEFGSTFTMQRYSEEVSYATISMIVSPNNTEDTGSFTGTYFTEKVDVNDSTFSSSIVKKYNVAINGSIDGTTLNQATTSSTGVTNNGTTLNIVNSYYGHTHNGAGIVIVQYNSSGDVIAYTSCTYIAKTTH